MKLKKGQDSFVNIGSASLLVVFLVLCFLSFASLSLSSAMNDYSFALRMAGKISGYYEASNQAEDFTASIDGMLENAYVHANAQEIDLVTLLRVLYEICNEYYRHCFIDSAQFRRGAHAVHVRHLNIHENYGIDRLVFGEKIDRIIKTLDTVLLPVLLGIALDIARKPCRRFVLVFNNSYVFHKPRRIAVIYIIH